MDEIRKTILGATLYDYECFVTQQAQKQQSDSANKAEDQPRPDAKPKQSGQPMNNFKSRGPLSGVAVDLLSQPNKKETLKGDIFCVLAQDSAGRYLEDCAVLRQYAEYIAF